MTKKEMLREMDENGWGHELTESDSYDDVKEEYDEMQKSFLDDRDMFPNGRDYDSEDWDK